MTKRRNRRALLATGAIVAMVMLFGVWKMAPSRAGSRKPGQGRVKVEDQTEGPRAGSPQAEGAQA